MINLRVEEVDVLIQQFNNVIIKGDLARYNFIKLFDYNANIYIGNNILNSKDYYIMDLTSYAKIEYNKQFIKDSIFYKYIFLLIKNISELDKIKIFNTLNGILDKNLYDYEINEDFIKLINSVCIFKGTVPIEDMIRYIVKYSGQTIILLYDSSYLKNVKINGKRMYCFDVSDSKEIEKYNLIFTDELKEFNYNILVESVVDLLPYKININIKHMIGKYFECYFSKKTYYIYNSEELVIVFILNKLYNNNQQINYPKCLINNDIIQSILIS